MDYIIFGMGTGASLVLVGWLLRELGPRIRDRAPAEGTVLSGSELVVRMSWARFCGTCGMAMLLCGLLILIVAGILTLISIGDDLGTAIILAVFALAVILMLLWTGLYLRQFGTMGIFRPRVKPATPVPATGTVGTGDGAASEEPGQIEDASGTPADVPFEQAATARGGFGRFAGFMRRETDPGAKDAVAVDADGDDKRLSPDDPLVTEPREAIAATGPEATIDEGSETSGSKGDSTEDAIATLRQRRLERLAQDPGDQTED